eukprot:TRINITY_DN69831_c0_g1_i1.p1 TRINITY_DN69831_c0_g1~~TRINITY_DN69831_c0_g1_i1.p1  ORF type:complete len:401 (+),score=39.30 TRINITY_DN69831_c0_g1_i1:207-1409(+)
MSLNPSPASLGSHCSAAACKTGYISTTTVPYSPPASYAEGLLPLTDGHTFYTLEVPTVRPRGSPVPVVVMVHGLGMDLHCWDSYVRYFLAEGFAVLRYDLYARGRSTLHAPKAARYTPERYILQALEVLHSVPYPPDVSLPHVAIWLGVSTGCTVGALVTHTAPHLFRSLILIDPAIGRTSKAFVTRLIEPRALYHAACRVALPLVKTRYRAQTDQYFRPKMPCEVPPEDLRLHLFPNLFEKDRPAAGGGKPTRQHLRQNLRAVCGTNADLFSDKVMDVVISDAWGGISARCAPSPPPPVLLIWSAEDSICPVANASEMIARYGRAHVTYHEIPGRSHMGAFEIPTEVMQTMMAPWLARMHPRPNASSLMGSARAVATFQGAPPQVALSATFVPPPVFCA